jgi:Flp pilus assembly protein TadG
MLHQNQPVPRPNVGARRLAPAGAIKLWSSSRAKRGIWVLRAAAGWQAIRIRVCLQAYRNRKTDSALAAEAAAPHPIEQRFRLLRATDAAALIEFAVALPLLVVLIVGIFDFGGAFNLKQELSNAAREGARFGAAQPTNDLASVTPPPPSVDAIRLVVDSYLQTAKINDCGLNSVSGVLAGSLGWFYTASSGCAGTMTLTVTRGVAVPKTIGGATVNILCTTVQISYPYQWHFNSVIQLLVPGANYSFTNIQGDATAVNMD